MSEYVPVLDVLLELLVSHLLPLDGVHAGEATALVVPLHLARSLPDRRGAGALVVAALLETLARGGDGGGE